MSRVVYLECVSRCLEDELRVLSVSGVKSPWAGRPGRNVTKQVAPTPSVITTLDLLPGLGLSNVTKRRPASGPIYPILHFIFELTLYFHQFSYNIMSYSVRLSTVLDLLGTSSVELEG